MTDFPPDPVIVAGLRSGDEEVFALLLDEWSRGMLRLARSYVSTAASAEEVVQDTWLAVIRAVGTFEGRSSLRTWVYRILVNTARRRGERESRTIPVSSVGGERPDGARPEGGPEGAALAGEVRALIEKVVGTLPSRQRAVITLRDMEGYGSDEVCEILSISPANQRVLLHRARAAVRDHLAAYYDGIGGP
ncbi:RNA polymerase sigma factor [Herbidospora mongoliensis]|uniref:RNA polymerase sigma factor n=1 Tax=Herbidospora mongoliensis TaxID=688067 RepID=UPI001FDFBAA3|nr:RNA polymerase sigma factor [Herbidospora mongoliensis]